MDKLLRGAYEWRRLCRSQEFDSYFDDVTLKTHFVEQYRITHASKTDEEQKCAKIFFERLCVRYSPLPATTTDWDHVLIIDANEKVVVFDPFAATIRDVIGVQSFVFWKLVEYWQHHDTIERLIFDLSKLTFDGIAEQTKHSTRADISFGLGIWSTLPCKIQRINIRLPDDYANSSLTTVANLFLSAKLRRKITYT